MHETSRKMEKTYGLTAAQLFVLQTLVKSSHPLSVGELASRTYTHQSSVSTVLARLIEKGLINCSSSKEDSRMKEVSLTKKGEKTLSKPVPTLQERLADAIRKMSKKQRSQLVKGLAKWVQLAEFNINEPPLFMEEANRLPLKPTVKTKKTP